MNKHEDRLYRRAFRLISDYWNDRTTKEAFIADFDRLKNRVIHEADNSR